MPADDVAAAAPATKDRPWSVLWSEPRPARADIIDHLTARGHTVTTGPALGDQPWTRDELSASLDGVDVLMMGSRDRIDDGVLEHAPRLLVISKFGIGVDNIDVSAATRRGIVVMNTPVEANIVGVAEGTLARMLALAKQLRDADRLARQGAWKQGTTLLLRGKTVGIVGFGRIGRIVGRLLEPFGVTRLFTDPAVPDDELQGCYHVSLSELLDRCDVVTLHPDLNETSYHIIGAAELTRMMPTAILINTARGGLVDENALVAALRDGQIAAAALDTFEVEPIPPGHPILDAALADQLILSPHAASRSPELERTMPDVLIGNVLQALAGEPGDNVVNPAVLDRWQERMKAATAQGVS